MYEIIKLIKAGKDYRLTFIERGINEIECLLSRNTTVYLKIKK